MRTSLVNISKVNLSSKCSPTMTLLFFTIFVENVRVKLYDCYTTYLPCFERATTIEGSSFTGGPSRLGRLVGRSFGRRGLLPRISSRTSLVDKTLVEITQVEWFNVYMLCYFIFPFMS